jgi:hypothetical protein
MDRSVPNDKSKMVRPTTTAPSGERMEEASDLGSAITISMKDEDDDDESNSGHENDDDDEDAASGHVEQSVEEAKKCKPPKKKQNEPAKKKKKNRLNPVSRRGRTANDKPWGVIDPGTEIDVIGGSPRLAHLLSN